MDTPMARRLTLWFLHSVIALCGSMTSAYLYDEYISGAPPITWTDSAVHPKYVRAGDTIQVTRVYTIRRDVFVTVSRSLVKGDCAISCVSYNIPDDTFHLVPGTYTQTKAHKIPDIIEPGVYRLAFEWRWQNALGNVFVVRHPPLTIEVIR